MKRRLVLASCVAAMIGFGVVAGCSSHGKPVSASSSSTASAVTSSATDPHAAAVKVCKIFNDVFPGVAHADVALMKDFENQVPPDVARADLKTLLAAAQKAASRLQTALTSDVPNPPAGALRSWVDALGALIKSDPNAGPNDPNAPGPSSFREMDAAAPAVDACTPFS